MITATRKTPTFAPSKVVALPTRCGAWLRHSIWRTAFASTGGLQVHGALPVGGCVVVANHSSHADSAALMAALDSAHRPVVAAAADYWFVNGTRAAVCRATVSGFPVRRTGGGLEDLRASAAVLDAGGAVVVFPEGTRTGGDCQTARFHSGAARLAASVGVPLVAVGLSGTGRLLPKSGGAGPAFRPTRVVVRIGDPVVVTSDGETDCATATDIVEHSVRELAAHRAEGARDSRLRSRVASFCASRRALALAAIWGLCEALSWPIVPEFLLAVLVVAAPRRWVSLTAATVVGSALGGLIGFAVARGGVALPAPLTTARMHSVVTAQIAGEGSAAVQHQPLSGIPFKVYVRAAGDDAHTSPLAFTVAASGARAPRMFAAAAIFALLGAVGRRARRWYGIYLVLLTGGFCIGIAKIVLAWR
jgi:1-acyl-sn-glycerol-3-phosphate acyltransferase